MIGSCCRNESRPRKNADPVSDRTIQFWAVSWTQVPMLEVQAPIHWTRKSRYVNAENIRPIARDLKRVTGMGSGAGGAGGARTGMDTATKDVLCRQLRPRMRTA